MFSKESELPSVIDPDTKYTLSTEAFTPERLNLVPDLHNTGFGIPQDWISNLVIPLESIDKTLAINWLFSKAGVVEVVGAGVVGVAGAGVVVGVVVTVLVVSGGVVSVVGFVVESTVVGVAVVLEASLGDGVVEAVCVGVSFLLDELKLWLRR